MRSLFALIMAMALVCSVNSACAQKRVALVIGNSAYQNAPRLANPARDADAVAKMFRTAGFDVVDARNDVDLTAFRRLLRDFSDKSRDADMAVVYFAGHGIEVEGSNYLLPVDAALERDRDTQDEGISLVRVLQSIEQARSLRLVILDACRDNPFSKAMKRTVATRGLERGFASVEPNQPNTLIAFAAKAGSTALDGSGAHSPFTNSLLRHLTTPGLDLRKAFGRVRDEVMRTTDGRQEPFVYGSLGGGDVSLVAAVQGPDAAETQDAARRDYEFAERVGTRDIWISFLSRHRDGFYAELARGQLRKIGNGERTAPTETKSIEEARLTTERPKPAEEARPAKAENAKGATERPDKNAADRQQGGRSCTSTHAECVRMSTPFGPNWINNCARLRNACMRTGEWRSGLRNYSNVERR